jgi:NAD(P)-dependent dehydrogenase (short-subunit alcohol dehydrogenase family)
MTDALRKEHPCSFMGKPRSSRCAGGFGAGIASTLAAAGARVACVDIRADAAQATAASIVSVATAIVADVGAADDVRSVVSDATKFFGNASTRANTDARAWIGRSETHEDLVTVFPAAALAVLLAAASARGSRAHAKRDGFLSPRRSRCRAVWAGSRLYASRRPSNQRRVLGEACVRVVMFTTTSKNISTPRSDPISKASEKRGCAAVGP